MKKIACAALVSTVLCVAVSGQVSASHAVHATTKFGQNLVQNGGAEQGQQNLNGNTVVVPPHWVTTGSLTYASYTASGTPSPGPQAGNNFFLGGPSSLPTDTATQRIQVYTLKKTIATGKVTMVLSGLLGGYGGQNDNAQFSATFENKSKKAIGTPVTIGPVLAAERGNKTSFVYKTTSALVPKKTVSIVVTLTATYTAGSFCDGYADNLSVVLQKPKKK